MVIDELPGTDPTAFDRYFHKTLLDEYLNEHEPDWADNVVRDARGTLQAAHRAGDRARHAPSPCAVISNE